MAYPGPAAPFHAGSHFEAGWGGMGRFRAPAAPMNGRFIPAYH